MSLHLTQDEWDRIAADGRGVLFREGTLGPPTGAMALDPRFTQVEHPPAEFVKAAKACEMQHVESGGGPNGTNLLWHVTGNPDNNGLDLADCIDGKRRIAAVVEHLCFHEGQRLLRKDVCDCGTDDGLVTVGHVVATSGPNLQDDGTWSLTVEVAP